MKKLALALTLWPALALAATPDGKQIVLHGNANGAMPCAACHGVDGAGNPSVGAPALAGMPAAAIVKHLNHFASNPNSNPTMHSIASALSPDEMNAVAAYFSALKKPGT